MSNDNDIIRESLVSAERFSEIFERHIAALSTYVARRVGPEVSDDIISETFLIAFRKRRRFDQDRASALPWLMGIATRVLSQHRREQASHWRALQSAYAASDDVAIDDVDRSVTRLDASAEVERLYPRIAALSAADREVLFLHAWGDLTYEEIASALRMPIGTVRSKLSRIRTKLAAPSGGRHADPPPPKPAATHIRFVEQEIAHGHS
ncbi:RNA polymerase sigma factor [Microbacterium sp. H1-D42]|uniref:RNA polymerase sigma factor n=1 Tax=Microbacterium sp. H1-D42 TaxID=2925844 RepID=UPI001F5358D5|nr:RNA polymerase sigma factor [Microbacterium sp. H1-D42]UNK70931.1 RNA polymerase sigma factor [Microbacterium sp. H1-D42]